MESTSKANKISRYGDIAINVIFSILTLICIVPLILIFIISITEEKTVALNGYSFFPKKISFDSYRYIFNNGAVMLHAYVNTIIATVAGTILSLIIIALIAYPLSRKDFKYRKIFSFYVYFTMLFSGGMVPWYLVCTQVLHLKNTMWALIIPYLVNSWHIILLRTFYSTTLPDSIIESAKIDGAGEFTIFMKIVLPLSKPGLATIALFTTLIYWNDWWLPMMLISKENLYNLQYTIYKIQSNLEFITRLRGSGTPSGLPNNIPSETIRMAMCVLAIGPIVFAYPFFQKYFVKGLTIGAVKG